MYRQWAPRTVLCLFYVFTLVVGKMQKNSWEDLVPIKKNNFFRKVNFGTVVFCNWYEFWILEMLKTEIL